MPDNLQGISTIFANEGKVFVNGWSNRELFNPDLRASLDLVVQSRRMLGNRMTQHKVLALMVRLGSLNF